MTPSKKNITYEYKCAKKQIANLLKEMESKTRMHFSQMREKDKQIELHVKEIKGQFQLIQELQAEILIKDKVINKLTTQLQKDMK